MKQKYKLYSDFLLDSIDEQITIAKDINFIYFISRHSQNSLNSKLKNKSLIKLIRDIEYNVIDDLAKNFLQLSEILQTGSINPYKDLIGDLFKNF